MRKVQIAAALAATLGFAMHGTANPANAADKFGVKENKSPSGITKTTEKVDLGKKKAKGEEGSCKGKEGSCKGKEGSCKGKEGSCKGKEGSCKGKEGSCKGKEGASDDSSSDDAAE